jgi:CheY-like chemotaxis protein
MTVLAVDDDQDDLYLFKEALRRIDPTITLITVFTCNEALQLLEKNDLPDFIFLDINMPGMTGLDCLRIIRQNEKYDRIPVTVMSTELREGDIEFCNKNNATWFRKPVAFNLLIDELRHHIRGHKAGRQ